MHPKAACRLDFSKMVGPIFRELERIKVFAGMPWLQQDAVTGQLRPERRIMELRILS